MSDNIRIIVQKPASPIIKIAPEGTDGIGIASIELISTVGLVKTYRINYTNGNHFDYEVTDGSDADCEWGKITGIFSDQTDLKNALDAKADADDVYTKTETDTLLSAKADTSDVYTKGETDDLLDLKANAADVYTQTELDGIFDGIDNALDTKADASNVYTKTQTDNKLADKADADNVYTKAEADALLGDKADADDVYTKSETDTLLSAKANTADLGSLADQDTVDYQTEVTNKPTLGTMSAESASDYYDKDDTDALLEKKLTAHDGTLSGSVLSFTAESVHAIKGLTVAIEPVQSGSGDPSPDNVRPITGHTEATVTRTDVDIYDSDGTIANTNKSTVTINSKNSITVASNTAGTYISSKQLLSSYNLQSGKTYRLSAKVTEITGSGYSLIAIRDSSNTIVDRIPTHPLNVNEEGSFVFTYDPSVHNYISFFGTYSTSTTGSVTYSNINFRECVDTEIDLSSAGTVYGGSLNVLTGELTVDYFYFEGTDVTSCSIESTNASTTTVKVVLATNNFPLPYLQTENTSSTIAISNRFSKEIPSGTAGRMVFNKLYWYFVVATSELATVDQAGALAWLANHPTQLTYKMDTPLTVQLTANQMPSSLLGQNVLWADTGDSTALIQMVTGSLAYRDSIIDNVTDGILTIR